jgi:hypothetical protein
MLKYFENPILILKIILSLMIFMIFYLIYVDIRKFNRLEHNNHS